jgi:hypothetical protein
MAGTEINRLVGLCLAKLWGVAWIQSSPEPACRGGLDAGPGPPSLKEKSQLEPSKDGGDMTRDRKEPIQNMMQEDQRSTE